MQQTQLYPVGPRSPHLRGLVLPAPHPTETGLGPALHWVSRPWVLPLAGLLSAMNRQC